MKRVAILLPGAYPDALQPGEYNGDHMCCPGCGVVQRVEDPNALFSCTNPACDVSVWLELASAN